MQLDLLSKVEWAAELNRAAPSQQRPSAGARVSASTASLEQLLAGASGRNASDVLLIAGAGLLFLARRPIDGTLGSKRQVRPRLTREA